MMEAAPFHRPVPKREAVPNVPTGGVRRGELSGELMGRGVGGGLALRTLLTGGGSASSKTGSIERSSAARS